MTTQDVYLEAPAKIRKSIHARQTAMLVVSLLVVPICAAAMGLVAWAALGESLVLGVIMAVVFGAGVAYALFAASRTFPALKLLIRNGSVSIGEGGKQVSMPCGDVVLIESCSHMSHFDATLAKAVQSNAKSKAGRVTVSSATQRGAILLASEQVDKAGQALMPYFPNAIWIDSADQEHPPLSGIQQPAGLIRVAHRRRALGISLIVYGSLGCLFGVALLADWIGSLEATPFTFLLPVGGLLFCGIGVAALRQSRTFRRRAQG